LNKGIAFIHYEICVACGICVSTCPLGILEMNKIDVDPVHNPYPSLSDLEKCTGCGLCGKACPVEAISIQ
jgi:formate hydrogenlyase subunit 6/NADH:ubiquinone oxidoreductase subunit I